MKQLCVDDFGNEVYECRSGGIAYADNCAIVGPQIPGVKAKYVLAKTPEAVTRYKQSLADFRESEANCNTCADLVRVPHAKDKGGFLYGRCKYGFQRGLMKFHPDDPMHMICWQERTV